MSEYMFGVTRRKLSAAVCAERERVCIEEGGTGYTQILEPTHQWLGWFTGPNLGEPFNRDLARRVLERCPLPPRWRATDATHPDELGPGWIGPVRRWIGPVRRWIGPVRSSFATALKDAAMRNRQLKDAAMRRWPKIAAYVEVETPDGWVRQR